MQPQPIHAVARLLIRDWQTHKYALFVSLLLFLTILAVVAYYLNHPDPEPLADTWSYLYVVDRLQTRQQLVTFWRLPGYPLFIVLVYTFLGQGNLAAVSATQAALFVLATLELFVLAVMVFQHTWAAFLPSLFVGTNLTLLSYVKPILSEALALWLLCSLALAVVCFLSTPRRGTLWLITALTLLLLMTRPEWIGLPLFLFPYLLLAVRGREMVRRLLPHVLASLMLLSTVLGSYICFNATHNHFPGVSWIQNINALGKVLQYRMQDEAPLQYARIRRMLDASVAQGITDPYVLLTQQPLLSAHHASLAGDYARAILVRHPAEFLEKSVPILCSSVAAFHDESQIIPRGPFGALLEWLQSVSRTLDQINLGFFACVVAWLLLFCWQRTRGRPIVQGIGALILLSLYGLVSTTLGAYREDDYIRLHVPFDPLLTIVVMGTFLVGSRRVFQQVWQRWRAHYFRGDR